MTKTALITGGSSGLGFAYAEILGRQGYEIIILARNQQRIDNAVHSLHKKGISARGIQADVTDSNQLAEAATNVKSMQGNLDFLILNAGEVKPKLFCDYTSVEELKKDLDIDLWGVIQTAFFFLPLLAEGSKILITSSGFGLIGAAGYTTYCAAKAGVINFGDSLRREMLYRKINVYVACPGDTDTPQLAGEIAGQPQWMKEQSTPRKVIPVETVAKNVLDNCNGSLKLLILPHSDVKLLWFAKKILPQKFVNYLADRMFPRPR